MLRFDDFTQEIENGPRRADGDGARGAAEGWPTSAAAQSAYDASDSEHEQPSWLVPESASWRAEREREKALREVSSSESETSGGGTDDDRLRIRSPPESM